MCIILGDNSKCVVTKWPNEIIFTEAPEVVNHSKQIIAGNWSLSGVFIVNFEHISHLFLVFLLFI